MDARKEGAAIIVCFLGGVAHVGNVEAADIRTVDGVAPRAHRIHPRIESERRHPIVALASEEELRHEQLADIRLARDRAAREFIQVGGILGGLLIDGDTVLSELGANILSGELMVNPA